MRAGETTLAGLLDGKKQFQVPLFQRPYSWQEEQLKQYRVRHRRAQFLAGLEARWAETTSRTGLLP